MLLIFLVFCVILLCVFMFRVPCCDILCVSSIKNYVRFVLTSSCLLEGSYLVCWRDHILFVGGIISCLLDGSYLVCVICVYLCVVVSNTYYVCYCFVILRIAYLMLPASMDYPYVIALQYSITFIIYILNLIV